MNIKPQTLFTTLATSLITTLIVALPLSAEADSAKQCHDGKHNKFMQFFDANGDGSVTIEEFQGSSKTRFERIDADNNGVISKEEFANYMQSRRDDRHKDRLAAMDADKDGQVSKEEFLNASQARAERKFARMDKDDNGLLSGDELTSHKKHKPHFGKKVFSKLDANGDGQITQEESQAAWSEWFKRLDTNSDQVVSGDEIEQARSRW